MPNGEGTLSVFHEKTNGNIEPFATITTQKGARTIAADDQTNLVYLPAAEFEVKGNSPQARPKMIPGTFHVLVIGK